MQLLVLLNIAAALQGLFLIHLITHNGLKELKLIVRGIAMDCGFNSKSSFNIALKKFTGLTPSEYRKQKAASPITQ